VCCKLVIFVSQIFPLFIPEIIASFTSYIAAIIPIYFGSDPVTTVICVVYLNLTVLNILCQIIFYAASVRDNLASLWPKFCYFLSSVNIHTII
jgi:hypothetical protein